MALANRLFAACRIGMLRLNAWRPDGVPGSAQRQSGQRLDKSDTLIERGGESQIPRVRNAIGRAGEQAIRAGQIIQRLRGLAIRGDGERRIEAIPPLVKEAAELALIGSPHRGVSIRIEDDLGHVTVIVDKIQIQQVLLNLLRNAAEAVAEQESREISLCAEARGDIVQISVVDNGPGLPDAVRDKLFQPFVTTKQTGMGVGLSICHTIVAAHDGRLWAEPNLDGGTIRMSVSI